MFTRAGRITTGEEVPYVPGGTFERLSRLGRGLGVSFLSRPRGVAAEEAEGPPATAESARRDANSAPPAMDAGITGGMSLFFGGQPGTGRRRG